MALLAGLFCASPPAGGAGAASGRPALTGRTSSTAGCADRVDAASRISLVSCLEARPSPVRTEETARPRGPAAVAMPSTVSPVAATSTVPAGAAVGCGPWSQQPGQSQTGINGLASTAPDNVWAVGASIEQPYPLTWAALAEHWDGQAWSTVPVPTLPGATDSVLYGVTAISSSDVWAVGTQAIKVQQYGPTGNVILIDHWDGQSWSATTAPPVSGSLASVSASGPDDVWAVGASLDPSKLTWAALVEHWDGQRWTPVSVPAPAGGSSDGFLSVTAATPGDAWAVGVTGSLDYDYTSSYRHVVYATSAEAYHWDGQSWKEMNPLPPASAIGDSLLAVSSTSPSDVWAVGGYRDSNLDDFRSFIVHWDGTTWTQVAAPPLGSGHDVAQLTAVSARTATDAWVAGGYADNIPLVAHWDGTQWTASPAPVSGAASYVDAVADVSATEAWIGGSVFDTNEDSLLMHATPGNHSCVVSVSDAGFTPATVAPDQGAPVQWLFWGNDYGQGNHTATDASGMGLFDSNGSATPLIYDRLQYYDATFTTAGTYPVEDDNSGNRSAVVVPLTAPAARTDAATPVTITWASAAPPSGFVSDVQIQRPGDSGWSAWQTGVTTTSAAFTPDAGDGVYSFQARLRKVADGTASNWSPAVAVSVGVPPTAVPEAPGTVLLLAALLGAPLVARWRRTGRHGGAPDSQRIT